MKNILLSGLALILLVSCAKKEEPTILQKIANANGVENWNKVTELKFTFNVDRDSSHFERSWIWKPKENSISMTSNGNTISYLRDMPLDSAYISADRAFINDKYWLLAPLNLVWDNGFTHTFEESATAPISGETMGKLTIVYGSDGGYTPGDAYDLFVDDQFMVREWNYRKANATEPTLSSTWEDYAEQGGIKLAMTHKNKDGSFKLYFSGISVTEDSN